MGSIDEIFSIRIVIADFYMEKPIFGLDPRYSEFRGREVKRVPIIRIFGSNANGQKTCMHVHGVFPYFYIPYNKDDFESVHKAMYQIAINVDKAINVSLGQASSQAQHVFKIQLVKGIPFYGYHRTEHQLLKIYLYNPRFVRRAASMLQNGAIMGKNFHPFESHVPYILQFMIDFNLYGMSSLHIPMEIVKFRRDNDEDDIKFGVAKPEQILSTSLAKKVSCCSIEVDIGSNFILNRFQLLTNDNNVHSNPGIEAIWHDEKLRRTKLEKEEDDIEKLNKIPALIVPPTQERPNINPTDSDIFYRTGLLSKLESLESSLSGTLSDQTVTNIQDFQIANAVDSKEQRRTFNLKKILGQAVYPEECTQSDRLINASFIENHLSRGGSSDPFHMTANDVLLLSNTQEECDENNVTIKDYDSVYMNETVVDEELVLSLTQGTPMNKDESIEVSEEDRKMLDLLQELEEEGEERNHIDLDSTLSAFTQEADHRVMGDNEESIEEDDNDINLLDYTMSLEDVDNMISSASQGSKASNNVGGICQMDGAYDTLPTPEKNQRTPTKKKCPISPKKSPKSKSISKYAPLPLIFGKKSDKKNSENTTNIFEVTPVKRRTLSAENLSKGSRVSLRKNLAINELRRQSLTEIKHSDRPSTNITPPMDNCNTNNINSPTNRKKLRKTVNLDKTHITCSLTPRRRSERILKVYSLKEGESKSNEQVAKADNKKRKVVESPELEKNDGQVTPIEAIIEPAINTSIYPCEVNTEIIHCEKQRAKRKQTNSKVVLRHGAQHINVIPKENDKRLEGTESDISFSQFDLKTVAIQLKNLNEVLMQSKESNNSNEVPSTSSACRNIDNNIGNSIADDNTSEDDETVLCSDNEVECESSSKSIHRTPNLKRLRRSFRDSLEAKIYKQKSPKTGMCNSSKFAAKSFDETTEEKPSSSFTKNNEEIEDDDEIEDENDEKIHSFYEPYFALDSPALFSEKSSPDFCPNACNLETLDVTGGVKEEALSISKCLEQSSDNILPQREGIWIVPACDPPTYEEALADMRQYDIPEFKYKQPFYSDPKDVTKRKEIGTTVLHIPGNKLCDLPAFQSVLGHNKDIFYRLRCRLLREQGKTRCPKEEQLRQWCAGGKILRIEPVQLPPTPHDSRVWLKACQLARQKEKMKSNVVDEDEDSPIQVRRQKVIMIMKPDGDGNSDDDDDGDIMDISSCNLTLTPQTPLTPNEAEELKAVVDNKEKSMKNSQGSESSTISSQSVLREMERASFIAELKSDLKDPANMSMGLINATLNNTCGFKVNLENLQEAKADIECTYLTIVTLEVFVPTRGDLHPNPENDAIRCIFYALENNTPSEDCKDKPKKCTGYIIVNDPNDVLREGRRHGLDGCIEVTVVDTEIAALEKLLELCGIWDADIYAGYEIEMSSWGYVIERAKYLCLNIAPLLSRVPTQKVREFVEEDRDQFTELDIEMKLCGRILLDVWRLMRSEIALTSYTFENVFYHVMHVRCAAHSYRALTELFEVPFSRWIVLNHYIRRVEGTLQLLDQLDLIGRTSEMAKLIGIQFYEVLSRGSQFRVESMMLRIAKPRNLVPISPSVQQRAHMRAPEYLPLILEPFSRLYTDPLIVLDFQSLYPSMIIGYNYCFSTCLGRVEHLGHSTPFEFGASQLRISPILLRKLLERDLVTISPCGVVFLKSIVREGILPRMLTEILNTRQMVKQSMKVHKSNSALQRILHSRQLGLKLMANVTYGYTAANFSGRMPCVEVGDSVVAKGRETLERAIALVQANEKWNVKVVYGDTDSLFVLAPGRSRAQAFQIGEEIVEAVTKANPHPVKLKLEKVYLPCILQTKKRYVGYMYETADQTEPIFEAKGIETVRRDGCPAVSKMLEKVLKMLFETCDVSQIKQYVCRQFTKILTGTMNMQDLIFAKEFRGLNGYKARACVPALELTRKWMQVDPRRIPRSGERVPYVIVNGPPGLPLIRLVRDPHEVLANEGYKINSIYYITKAIIPPLNRCLLLVGANVIDWFSTLPRKMMTEAMNLQTSEATNVELVNNKGNLLKKSTISQYFTTSYCLTDCGRKTTEVICSTCKQQKQKTSYVLMCKSAEIQNDYFTYQQMCFRCAARASYICNSLDCPVMFVLEAKRRKMKLVQPMHSIITQLNKRNKVPTNDEDGNSDEDNHE